MAKRQTAETVYRDCIEKYHDVLTDVTGDATVISVPELAPLCEKAVTELVDDVELDARYMFDQFQYRYVLIAKCIQSGIVHASVFKREPENYRRIIETKITKNILDNMGMIILRTEMGVNMGAANQVFSWVFNEWQEVVDPKWSLDNAREMILATYQAAYQLGVSWYMQANKL